MKKSFTEMGGLMQEYAKKYGKWICVLILTYIVGKKLWLSIVLPLLLCVPLNWALITFTKTAAIPTNVMVCGWIFILAILGALFIKKS